MLQEQRRGRNHSAAAKSHCVKSSHSKSMVQDVAGSPHTSTISRGDGLNKSDSTIPASPMARIKTGTNTHGSSGSGGKGGVPRRLILTQDRNNIYHPNPISLKESRRALLENDAMVYLDGPQVYTCANCRTHLTSHDDIISKSFHGRNGMYPSNNMSTGKMHTVYLSFPFCQSPSCLILYYRTSLPL